jgi:signal peptidase I
LPASGLARVWKDESFQTAVIILFIVSVVFGFWYGSRLFLNTQYPILAVASGSMSLPKGVPDDGWSNPFGPTLHTGDLIIIEGVNPQDIYAAPYNASGRSGDIIVFRATDNSGDLIVHRAVAYVLSNGSVVTSKTNGETVVAFVTQGDANDVPGPYSPTPVQNIIGKVIMRIPWVGHVALFMRNSNGIIVILILIMVLIIIEFALPPALGKKPADEQEKRDEKAPEPEVSTSHQSTR